MTDTDVLHGEWVTKDDLRAWLAGYGLDMSRIAHIEITPEGLRHQEGRVCLKVTTFALNAEGKKFIDPTTRAAAREVVWVPLRSSGGMP